MLILKKDWSVRFPLLIQELRDWSHSEPYEFSGSTNTFCLIQKLMSYRQEKSLEPLASSAKN